MEVDKFLAELWRNHRGKIIGILLGFLFALFVVSFNFWKAIFITLCICIGFYIGKKIDNKVDIKKSVENLFR